MLWLYNKKSTGNQIRWRFSGLDLKKPALNIELINPTNTPISFSAFVADLVINGTSAGILDYRQATILEANGVKNITIPVKLNPLAAITVLPTLRNKALIKNAQVILDGTINAENISIPFKQQISLV